MLAKLQSVDSKSLHKDEGSRGGMPGSTWDEEIFAMSINVHICDCRF